MAKRKYGAAINSKIIMLIIFNTCRQTMNKDKKQIAVITMNQTTIMMGGEKGQKASILKMSSSKKLFPQLLPK